MYFFLQTLPVLSKLRKVDQNPKVMLHSYWQRARGKLVYTYEQDKTNREFIVKAPIPPTFYTKTQFTHGRASHKTKKTAELLACADALKKMGVLNKSWQDPNLQKKKQQQQKKSSVSTSTILKQDTKQSDILLCCKKCSIILGTSNDFIPLQYPGQQGKHLVMIQKTFDFLEKKNMVVEHLKERVASKIGKLYCKCGNDIGNQQSTEAISGLFFKKKKIKVLFEKKFIQVNDWLDWKAQFCGSK